MTKDINDKASGSMLDNLLSDQDKDQPKPVERKTYGGGYYGAPYGSRSSYDYDDGYPSNYDRADDLYTAAPRRRATAVTPAKPVGGMRDIPASLRRTERPAPRPCGQEIRNVTRMVAQTGVILQAELETVEGLVWRLIADTLESGNLVWSTEGSKIVRAAVKEAIANHIYVQKVDGTTVKPVVRKNVGG